MNPSSKLPIIADRKGNILECGPGAGRNINHEIMHLLKLNLDMLIMLIMLPDCSSSKASRHKVHLDPTKTNDLIRPISTVSQEAAMEWSR